MLAEFSIYPLGAEHLSKDLAKVIDVLDDTGVDYRLGPMSTTVEGGWEHVIATIRRCHDAVAAGHERVITTITVDDRKRQPHHLTEMITSVEHRLGRQAKH